jgi:hypothetical protein
MMQFSLEDRLHHICRGLRLPVALLTLVLGSTNLTTAQSVRVSTSADSVTVGDRFHLHLAADYPDGIRPELPDFSQGDTTIGDLQIIKQVGFPRRSTASSGRTDSVTYEVTTFALDTARVPPISIRFSGEGATMRSTSEPFVVAVGSLVPEDAENIKGLAPLASFPRPLWPWVLGGSLALILGAALLYLFLRTPDEPEEETLRPEPTVPPYAEAMTRLQELETMEISAMDSPKPFFVELSDLLRTYIARTTTIHARELTTNELVHLLERRDGPLNEIYNDRRIERIRVILRLADLVKFADRRPKPEDSLSALEATRKTVRALHQSSEEASKEISVVREQADVEVSVEN